VGWMRDEKVGRIYIRCVRVSSRNTYVERRTLVQDISIANLGNNKRRIVYRSAGPHRASSQD